MIVIWTFFLYFHFKLKAENKKIVTIGDIEFTRKGIIKHIGDSAIEFDYNSISRISLKKHIPAVSVNDSRSGFFSYILSIEFKDSHIENMVVSDIPSGKFHDLSITHTLKTLKKIAPADINLE